MWLGGRENVKEIYELWGDGMLEKGNKKGKGERERLRVREREMHSERGEGMRRERNTERGGVKRC